MLLAEFTKPSKTDKTQPPQHRSPVPGTWENPISFPFPFRARSQSDHSGDRDVRGDQVADLGQGTRDEWHVQEPVWEGEGGQRAGAERLGGQKGEEVGKRLRVRL